MEQESSSSESRERERAASSEPSSTRPNPFDGGDLSSRKRRRTSLAGSASRSRSVESLTSLSRSSPNPSSSIAIVSDTIMNIDTPNPAIPSTPPRPPHLSEAPDTEPRSSRVTINLRNSGLGLDDLPESPGSPSRPRPQSRLHSDDNVKASVEDTDMDLNSTSSYLDAGISPSSSSLASAGPSATIEIEDDDDEDDDEGSDLNDTTDIQSSLPEVTGSNSINNNVDIRSIILDFPYHTPEETFVDTLGRLVTFFQSHQAQVDEVLTSLRQWFDSFLTATAKSDMHHTLFENYLENKAFWHNLPEIFSVLVFRKNNLTKSPETREIAVQFFAALPQLAARFLIMDIRTIELVTVTSEATELDLLSPSFCTCLAHITRAEEPQQAYNEFAAEPVIDPTELLDVFQNCTGGSIARVERLVLGLVTMVPRFPRKAMDYLANVCPMVESILRDSYRRINFHADGAVVRSQKNLSAGLRIFRPVATSITTVIDKFVNNLSSDAATALLSVLTKILQLGLNSGEPEAALMLQKHQESNPTAPPNFLTETLPYEWRFDILIRLVRSRQMQLRVVAVTTMCGELVTYWKRFSTPENDPASAQLLRFFSAFLSETGLVDYILGPTCHPEITLESSNIIGFLLVTKTYTQAHTDLFWQTTTTTQDPRVADALLRMMSRTVHLMLPEHMAYVCEKLHTLPMDSFTVPMKELLDNMIKHFQTKLVNHHVPIPAIVFMVCLRLLRESSAYGTQGTIAHPDINDFASTKLKELLYQGSGRELRQELVLVCINDLASRSNTTSGSLSALSYLTRQHVVHDITMLATQHDFIRLQVEDFESTLEHAQKVGFTPIYASHCCIPRREFITHAIIHLGQLILDSNMGLRLWNLLVGPGASCQEDRKAGWANLNYAARSSSFANPFLATCLNVYLLDLEPEYLCDGALEFVRKALITIANSPKGLVLDDDNEAESGANIIELLWQMILKAPDDTIESQTITTLVHDVFVDSQAILSFPLRRARKVHSGLVTRCLEQLAQAAGHLMALSDATPSGSNEPESEEKTRQSRYFLRSLAVLQFFLKTLQGRTHFTSPDLRSLMPESPGVAEGDQAGLKFQGFDGEKQTDIHSLDVGRLNTAASLLARIREATGYENYRIFYRGVPLTPTEDQICKSLEELGIHDGIILVKREPESLPFSGKVKPGVSPLEIEILSRFKELWEYLSMEQKLAKEIYHFLVRIPADGSILGSFEDPATSYRDVFPLSQPFKSLYAIHALVEFLSIRRLKTQILQVAAQDQVDTDQYQAIALEKAMSLVVAAICDPAVIESCPNEQLQVLLSNQLVESFVLFLKDSTSAPFAGRFLSSDLLERLLATLNKAAEAPSSETSLELIQRTLEALFECCAKSLQFWKIFRQHPGVKPIIQTLLLDDERPHVRKNVSSLIRDKSLPSNDPTGVSALDIAEMFWPIAFDLLPRAIKASGKCDEIMNLTFILMRQLAESESALLDLPQCLCVCGNLLLSHTSTEDITSPDRIDRIAYNLIQILHYGIMCLRAQGESVRLSPDFTRDVFRKHLFPPDDEDQSLVPKACYSGNARHMLCEIVFFLVKDNRNQCHRLLTDLNHLVALAGPDSYRLELPQLFDRSKALRSSCGYTGLRNLSNTCYLNSLFTQLFMNNEFRNFMLRTPVVDPAGCRMLSETQSLFGWLQDSLRRFVDPIDCVSQIMTYDETPIDIHNQMDVDEFYNLLFDRWEAQLANETEKKKMRSIFGGQLVQQVKSKECEHISERIEPFSAIQCDIKGKSNLDESLQAYVNGEIMEGENKYKCEMCDRHVDAVKRACLKDIPDNLIFHLKRFDFSLRTLQRSKINDHFSFPAKIDMQPYTVEHLTCPDSKAEPDVFELVGVLVHSGTAESGHYYSFIRERPSGPTGGKWVEFNDDVVSQWDPALLEAACFGGQDCRQYDNGFFDKVYSAYMLFYQRSSSVEKERQMLARSERSQPLRFQLPIRLELNIKKDNWAIVQRHCLHDPGHIPWMKKVLSHVWSNETCSPEHKIENFAMNIAIGHLDQIASRAKDTPDFDMLYQFIVSHCQRCPKCSLAFIAYLRDHPIALQNLVQKNADQGIRQQMGRVFIFILQEIKNSLPHKYCLPSSDTNVGSLHAGMNTQQVMLAPTALQSAVGIFRALWDSFHTSLKSWPEYFGTLTEFVAMGKTEAAALLDQDFLWRTIMIISADQALDLPPQYARMAIAVSRRMATRPPNYENIIAFIDMLIGYMDPKECHIESPYGRLRLAFEEERLPYTAHEVNCLHEMWNNNVNIFIDKLIATNQNHVATDSIITRLVEFGDGMERSILTTLRVGITGQIVTHIVGPYLRAAATYVRASNSPDHVSTIIKHICNQTMSIQSAEGAAFLEFYKETFDASRRTQEDFFSVQVESLIGLQKWVPGLLGCIDHTVSYATEELLQDVLFRHGPSPIFAENEGGNDKAEAVLEAAKALGIACLLYLQENYVSSGQQAPRDTVVPLERIIKECSVFIDPTNTADELTQRFLELSQSVLEPLGQLTVDEIEEDGSGMWSDSSSGTLDENEMN